MSLVRKIEFKALRFPLIPIAVLLLFVTPSAIHAADFKIKPVVVAGDPAPDGGAFLGLGLPRLNTRGDIAFAAATSAGVALYLLSEEAIQLVFPQGEATNVPRLVEPATLGIAQIACPFDPKTCGLPFFQSQDFFQLPNGNVVSCQKNEKSFLGVSDYRINDSRELLLPQGTVLAGSVVRTVRCPIPEFFGSLVGSPAGIAPIGITNSGTVALLVGGFADTRILLINGGGVDMIGLKGTPAPTGGTIQFINTPVINENEDLLVPFRTSSDFLAPHGLLLLSGDLRVPVVLSGAAAPGGRTFRLIRGSQDTALMNNVEQVAFNALLDNGNEGIFRRDPDGTITTLIEGRFTDLFPGTVSINDKGDVAASVTFNPLSKPKGSIMFFSSNGSSSTVVSQGDSAPGGGTFQFIFFPNVNSKGEIIFFAFLSNGKHGIFIASAGLETEFVDPVPDLLAGSAVTSDPTQLAKMGRVVTGIAADDAARVVVRVKTGQIGTAEFSLVDETGAALPPSNFNGFLSPVSEELGSGSVSVPATDVEGFGPMAFAAFHAPMDFSTSPNSVEAGKPDRKISIKVKLTTSTGETVESTESLKIVRPPVILVHGLWSDDRTWDSFAPLITDPALSVHRINYKDSNAGEISSNTTFVLREIKKIVEAYKVAEQASVVRADLVTHSMGGLLARMLPVFSSSFLRDDNFEKGDVHKLINIGTPHFGSELAETLRPKKNRFLCTSMFSSNNAPIDEGAIDDLSPGSDALRVINGFPSKILIHNNVGIASPLQKEINSLGGSLAILQSIFICGQILPSGGFDEIFNGDNDLLVSATSQRGGLSSASSAVTNFPPNGPNLIHTTANGLFDLADGEAELESPAVSSRVIQLLNSPMNSPLFVRLSP